MHPIDQMRQQIIDEINEKEWRKLLACTTEGASQTELGDEQADDARVGAVEIHSRICDCNECKITRGLLGEDDPPER